MAAISVPSAKTRPSPARAGVRQRPAGEQRGCDHRSADSLHADQANLDELQARARAPLSEHPATRGLPRQRRGRTSKQAIRAKGNQHGAFSRFSRCARIQMHLASSARKCSRAVSADDYRIRTDLEAEAAQESSAGTHIDFALIRNSASRSAMSATRWDPICRRQPRAQSSSRGLSMRVRFGVH
jgi:hypothetical protein